MIFFDTETTGLPFKNEPDHCKQPRIVELAAIKTDEHLNEIARFSTLINPQCKLPPEAAKWYDITDDMLAGAPVFPFVLKELILPFWKGEETVVAYNVSFDLEMMWWELKRIGWECRFPYCWDIIDAIQYRGGRRIKLDTWSQEVYGADYKIQTHRAMDDTERLLHCYRSLG
jgi:DNA polymerase III epsilon subunit-like protein